MKEKSNLLEKNNVENIMDDGEKRKSSPLPVSLKAMTVLLYSCKVISGAQNFAILPYMVDYDPYKTAIILGSYIFGISVGSNFSGI